MLELVVQREEAKEEVCVIDDKYITPGKEKGPQLLQKVITNAEELQKTLKNEFQGQEIKATDQMRGESHLNVNEKYNP